MNLSGHLAMVCAADAHGRTFIREQSFRAPYHLSKPYWDEHALIVQIVNPTAGVFAGDTLTSRVAVESGARLLLTTPSANRIHAMPSGRASLEQSFSVANGGWLEVMPELFIPQADSRIRQRTTIEVADGGEMFFVESLAPGRVARGESFAFTAIDWEFDLRHAGCLIARERFVLQPSDESTTSLRRPFPTGYYASCYIITSRISPERLRKIRVFQDDAYLSLDYMKQEGEMYRKGGPFGIMKEEVLIEKDQPLDLELASFCECARSGRQPKVSGQEGAAALELALQITELIEAGIKASGPGMG